jgi:outer membrane protein TolC
MQTRLLALLLFICLAGCAHYQPEPISPGEKLSELESRSLKDEQLRRYLEAGLNREFAVWPPAEWDLNALTLVAFFFHPDLDAARAKWDVAEAGEITAGQSPNPTISVSPAYDSTTFIPTPWIVGLNLDVPIETAGKRGLRQQQARNLSEAARLGLATVAWEVRSRLRQALVEIWTAREAEVLLKQQQAVQQDIVKLLEGQLEAGAVSLNELTRERITLEQTQMASLDAHNRCVQGRVQLASALGLPAQALNGVELSFVDFARTPDEIPSAEARRRALLSRADLLGALAEYATSEASLQLEVAKQYPDFHLSPGYQYDQGDNKWGVGIGFELPVMNRNRGPIAEAEARRREQAAKFNSIQARVLGEIENALAGLDNARQKLAAAATLLEQLGRQERIAQGMFEAGEVSRQAVATAKLERAIAALGQLDAQAKAQMALGQLEAALQIPLDLPLPSFETLIEAAKPGKKW